MADIIKTVKGVLQRYKDNNDGTYALQMTTSTGTPTDIIKSENGVPIRYRDMGDGTYAEIVSNG